MAWFCALRRGCFTFARWFVGMILLCCAATRAEAADKFWGNMAGGSFNTAGNWQGGSVPGAGDIAHFMVVPSPLTFYTVTFSASVTNQGLKVEDDNVIFDLGSRTYTLTSTPAIEIGKGAGQTGLLNIRSNGIGRVSIAGNIFIGAEANATGTLIVSSGGLLSASNSTISVGRAGTGTLTVNDGSTISGAPVLIIGDLAGINGTGNITGRSFIGGNASTVNAGNVFIGNQGTGTLNITDGGFLHQSATGQGFIGSSGSGTVNVDGLGSRWINSSDLVIGNGNTGTLNITFGGRVDDAAGWVGYSEGSTGHVTVSGVGSQWNTTLGGNGLTVGRAGTGTLDILNGGSVQSLDAFVGRGGTSSPPGVGSGTVNVSGGSIWNNTGNLIIGENGQGTLTIQNSGNVFNAAAIIGNLAGSIGMVTVDGLGSDWISSAGLRVGNLGQGSLMVTAGGAVSSTDSEIGEVDGITSTATVDGTDSIWSVNGSLDIGDAGDGSLTISNGGAVTSTSGELADGDAADGFVTVTGAGSSWTMDGGTGTLFVGEDGTGTLNILDGGLVSNVESRLGNSSGSTGTVLVSGSDSTWTNSGDLSIGRFGAGELTIAEGGSVANRDGYIGREAASSGMATVTGAGSTWTNTNFLYVGYGNGGEGSLSVEAGGAVSCITGFVGNVAGSHGTATVDGLGSMWTTTGTLAVGNGTLTISNGGAVVTNGLFGTLAAESMWNADVTVVGQGSSWSLAGALLTVGFDGAATINILGGGNVVSLDARLAVGPGSTGAVVVSGAGSTWTIGGRLGVGGDASTLMSGGTGTLRIQPGASVNVAQNIVVFSDGLVQLEGGTLDVEEISLQGGGQFDFDSGTLHVGTFNGSLVNQGGTLAPGQSPGATTITGSYAQQSDAMLQIEIGGAAAGTFDVVHVGTIAGISGQLQLALIGGFEPAAGDAFTVLTTAGGIFGTFANVANGQRLTTTNGLGSFVVNYGAGSLFDDNQIVLSNFLAAADLGDFNFDGTVDAADYIVWRKGLSPSPNSQADYDLWRTNFGRSAGGGGLAGISPSQSSVPEPCAFLIFLSAAFIWSLNRRVVPVCLPRG